MSSTVKLTIGLLLLAVFMPGELYAAAAEGAAEGLEDSQIVRFFFIVAVMLVVGKASGEVFERIRQPAVLGELIAGAVLGGSVLGIIPTEAGDPLTGVVHILAEVGVVILLFEIGLETDLKEMFRVGAAASSVALVGVVLPFLFGFLFWFSPMVDPSYSKVSDSTTAIFVGATLTATSVGITARVLTDLKALDSLEGRLIIGAAVIDDILGLVLLGLVAALIGGGEISVLGVLRALGVAVGFLVVAIAVGLRIAPHIFGFVDQLQVRGVLLVTAFAFTLSVAALAKMAGSAMIVGAFAAGIILSGTNQFRLIEDRIKPVADIFTPIFFLSIGAAFDVSLLNPFNPENLPILGVGLALFIIAVIGKLVAGWAAFWKRYNRSAVGFGMVPRGEVGLIFANIGLAAGVLTTDLFSAIILMVIGSTFISPPLVKWRLARGGITHPSRD